MADYYQEEPGARPELPLPGVRRRPIVTWSLLAVNVIIWIAMENAGGSEDPGVLLDFGAMFGPFIANGEYWRLFTAMFLHVGLMHLLFNGFALFIFGRLVEGLYGHFRFAIIYVLSGLTGSVASYLINSLAIGAGASGAIFGVLAALAAFFVARRDIMGDLGRQNLSGILLIVAINLFFGFVTSGIDNWAHIGGFVGGFAIGLAFVPQYKPVLDPFGTVNHLVDTNSVIRRWWVLPAAAVVIFAGASLGTATMSDNPITHIHRAERYLESENYEEALDEIDQAIRLDSSAGIAYYLRGKILADRGDIRGALSEVTRAMRLGLDPETSREAISLLIALNARR